MVSSASDRESADRHLLEREALVLYQIVFGVSPSNDLVAQYVAAHAQWPHSYSDGMGGDALRLAEAGCDLEAIEYYLRLRFGPNPLTRKLHTILFLAEARRQHYDDFMTERTGKLACWISLIGHGFRSIYLFLKGWRHAVKYHVV